jgi:hypothetical protein
MSNPSFEAEHRQSYADPEGGVRTARTEQHLHGSSTIVVLCGRETPTRKYVDWEIYAALTQNMTVVGVGLPTIVTYSNGGTEKPPRLQDNIDRGYAEWVMWNQLTSQPELLTQKIEIAHQRDKSLISNTRTRKTQNG